MILPQFGEWNRSRRPARPQQGDKLQPGHIQLVDPAGKGEQDLLQAGADGVLVVERLLGALVAIDEHELLGEWAIFG